MQLPLEYASRSTSFPKWQGMEDERRPAPRLRGAGGEAVVLITEDDGCSLEAERLMNGSLDERWLGLSVKTVETYKSRLMSKLGLAGRAALVRYALQRGLLEEQGSQD